MYWYYKYPLIVVLIVLGIGILYTIWQSLPEDLTGKVSESIAEPFDSDTPNTDTPETEVQHDPESDPGSAAPRHEPAQDPGSGRALTDPLTRRTTITAEIQKRLNTAENQFEANNYLAARQLALKTLEAPGVTRFDRAWYAAADVVDRVNAIFMNSQTVNPERRAYTIQPGDSLSAVAAKFNTTVGAIQRLSDLDPTNPIIYPGSVLYRLDTDWRIHIDKGEFVLLLYNGDELYRLYRIGIGKQNKTPVGRFVISSKVIHPAWTPPGKNFPYGDPDNPLGTHWLGLEPSGDTEPSLKGYGIHGTWEPDSIGTAASRGCIRMLNEDVNELFDFIPQPGRGAKTAVTIED